MGKAQRFDCRYQACPSRGVLAHVAGKWTVLILAVLVEGTARFSMLRKRVDGVTQKVLTQTLRDLERFGLVSREIFPEVPPRVEYSLTPLGRSLVKVLEELRAWIDTHTHEVLAAEQRYEQRQRAAERREAARRAAISPA